MMAVILTGGESRRMGSDKALLTLDGGTVLETLVRRYQTSFPQVAVSVNRAGRFNTCGAIELVDAIASFGPMAGLHAAFTQSGADNVFLTAVDLPYGDPALARALSERLTPGYDACLIRRGNGRMEPLFGAYSRSCLPYLEDCIREESRAMRALLAKLRVVEVAAAALPAWDLDKVLYNMNRPADYRAVLAGRTGKIPALSFVGWSGSGKTTFLTKLIPVLKKRGVRLGVIKHDAHRIEIDKPGKDSFRLRAAGSDVVAVVGGGIFARIESRETQPDLREVLRYMDQVDLILTEGYKTEALPKIEIHRRETGKPLACLDDPALLAVISDTPLELAVPRFGLEDAEAVAAFIVEKVLGGRHGQASGPSEYSTENKISPAEE